LFTENKGYRRLAAYFLLTGFNREKGDAHGD
jgi:hypothetical protein